MKKKKLLLSLVGLFSVFALAGCDNNPSSNAPSSQAPSSQTPSSQTPSTPVEVKSLKIDNKDELTAEWHVGEASRTIDLTIDPVINIPTAIMNGEITVTSSDDKIVSTSGLYVYASGVGTATVTVAYGEVKDTVEITISERITEPEWIVAKTLAEITGDDKAEMTQGYIVEGTVSKWQYDDRTDATKYGNFYIKDSAGTEVLVYGATADATAMAFDSGTYKYTNRQDFLTNEFTKGVTINTKVRLAVLKTSYNGTVQFNAVVLAVNDTLVPNYVIDSGEVPSYQNNTYFLYEVTGTISAWQYDDRTDATKYGNFYLQTEESDPILIYGATASEGKITWGNGGLEFDNPQDFLTNAVTKDLDIGDTVTLRGIRADYNGTVELQGQIVVEVTEVGVSLDKDEAYLLPSETTNLKATVSGPEGTATTVTWASDHPEIATVDAEGKVTAVAAGTATITATSTADTTKKATATITVLDPSTAVTALKDVNVKDDKTVAKVRGVVDTINKSSAIINDGTGALLVYDGAFADAVKLGDYVEIYGTMDEYNNMAELLPVHYATLGADVTKPTIPAATPLTAEIVNAWDDEPATITPANVKRYSWTTTAAKDGNYWLLNIAGSDVKLEPYNIPDSISSKLKEGSTFNVEGYYLGWNAKNSYAQMAISSVTGEGGEEEGPVDLMPDTPQEGVVTYDMAKAAEGFGTSYNAHEFLMGGVEFSVDHAGYNHCSGSDGVGAWAEDESLMILGRNFETVTLEITTTNPVNALSFKGLNWNKDTGSLKVYYLDGEDWVEDTSAAWTANPETPSEAIEKATTADFSTTGLRIVREGNKQRVGLKSVTLTF